MPVGYEYGGPFLGQGAVSTGGYIRRPYGLGQVPDLFKIDDPIFKKNINELAVYCESNFANVQRQDREGRERVVDECSEMLSNLVVASMTVDQKWRMAPPKWSQLNYKLPTWEQMEVYFGFMPLAYDYMMDDQPLRDVLRKMEWNAFLGTLLTLDKVFVARIVGLRNIGRLEGALAFNRWLNNVSFDFHALWEEILKEPGELEKIERKAPEVLVERDPVDHSFERFQSWPVERREIGFLPWPWEEYKRSMGYAI